ncbi:MAG: hypothetical protein H7210_00550 [Pyrinomonadaceae bacterium]|nr:hypothetical protein [Phycisphaerales bacterium]
MSSIPQLQTESQPICIPQSSSPARAVIIGAGAVGSHLAASLRQGVLMLIVDPNKQVRAAFENRGVEAASMPMCTDSSTRQQPGFFRPGDVAILTTSASVAASATGAVPRWVPIVCLSNGVIPELASARAGALSYGVVEFAVSTHGPGLSDSTKPGWLTLQRQSPGDATAWLAASLNPRLQRARLTDHIEAHRHSKLILNSSLDPVAAIIGGSIGDVFRGRESFHAFRLLLGEGLAVARAGGWRLRAVQGVRPDLMSIIFGTPLVGLLASKLAGRQASAVTSTLAREVHRGELGEAEYLSGAIALEGARLGVPTPMHIKAMILLRRMAATPASGTRRDRAMELIGSKDGA